MWCRIGSFLFVKKQTNHYWMQIFCHRSVMLMCRFLEPHDENNFAICLVRDTFVSLPPAWNISCVTLRIVSCIGWREGDIFITVKLCLMTQKESIERSGSKSYGWEAGNSFPQDTVSTLPVLSPVFPHHRSTFASCIYPDCMRLQCCYINIPDFQLTDSINQLCLGVNILLMSKYKNCKLILC